MDYRSAGVDITTANLTKAGFQKLLDPISIRVMNRVGAFASLYKFDNIYPKIPVLVMKTEEPGSKQLLAFELDMYESICHDMINHLVNDCIMMGAHPLIVQDCIVCGKLERDKVTRMVGAMAEACKNNRCSLVGGETSEQPGVIPAGTYILSSSIVGVVEHDDIIDGSKIREGDEVIAITSNGPHTNGYTLIRAILKENPKLLEDQGFMQDIMRPHAPYYRALRDTFPSIHGLAHITGGGIQENLNRILPSDLEALIDFGSIKILDIFKRIKEYGSVPEPDMIRTFNLGVGVAVVTHPSAVPSIIQHLSSSYYAYKIGKIIKGNGSVTFEGRLNW